MLKYFELLRAKVDNILFIPSLVLVSSQKRKIKLSGMAETGACLSNTVGYSSLCVISAHGTVAYNLPIYWLYCILHQLSGSYSSLRDQSCIWQHVMWIMPRLSIYSCMAVSCARNDPNLNRANSCSQYTFFLIPLPFFAHFCKLADKWKLTILYKRRLKIVVF